MASLAGRLVLLPIERKIAGRARCTERFTRTGKTHRNEIGDIRRVLTILAKTASQHQGRDRKRRRSAEYHRQQARAEEHEARRRQGKKSVGDNVVVAHGTPTDQMLFRIY